MSPPPLAALQAWMQSVLQHPAGVVAGVRTVEPADGFCSIDAVVTPSQRLSAEARLAIYGHAYFARLLDCLKAEFPAVLHAAGEDAFGGFAVLHLAFCPSRSDTLAELGREFSESLRRTRPPRGDANGPPDFADFLIELAVLERCYSEVFDGPGPEQTASLSNEMLAALAPEQFADTRLPLHSSVRLLTMQFPCHEYASAVRQGREPVPPTPTATRLVVYRKSYVVRRFAVTEMEYAVLSALQRGETVGAALEAAVPFLAQQESPSETIRRCFAAWTTAPLFREPESV